MLRASSLGLGHLPTRHRPCSLFRCLISSACQQPTSHSASRPTTLQHHPGPQNHPEEGALSSLPPLIHPTYPTPASVHLDSLSIPGAIRQPIIGHLENPNASFEDSSLVQLSVPHQDASSHIPVEHQDVWTPFLHADKDIWSDNPTVHPGMSYHQSRRDVPPLSLPQNFMDDFKQRMAAHQPNIMFDDVLNGGGGGDFAASLDYDTMRMKLLFDLSRTPSAAHAWEAYIVLRNLKSQGHHNPPIPFPFVYRLSDLLACTRPRTPKLFYQLLDVATFLRRYGGTLRSSDWTALIHSAGMMRRGKPTLADFERSLSIYQDMIEGRPPGSGIMKNFSSFGHGEDYRYQMTIPDIFTYNALMTVACHTLKRQAVEYVLSLLKKSGLQWSRITYLTLLDYFSDTKTIECVRSVASRLNGLRYDLGIDGINACLWAYGQSGRVDMVKSIFRLLWHNISSKSPYNEELLSLAQDIEVHEHIIVPNGLVPDELTFNVVIQILAYHGDFKGTLKTFADMLSTEKVEDSARSSFDEHQQPKPEYYSPNYVIYRAIFLGFSRHAVAPQSQEQDTKEPTWSLDNLKTIFNTFMAWDDAEIKPQLIYWIVLAFDKASGRDIVLLREVWLRLEKKFNGPWEGEDDRLTRIRKALFPLEKYGLNGFK
ncbi:hypothetical protein BDQ17DRAFT_1349007 [Cyathus striatus]|nr:hypothetical protein BDQ17DRAFT_1349007 [Cyathus striatus]